MQPRPTRGEPPRRQRMGGPAGRPGEGVRAAQRVGEGWHLRIGLIGAKETELVGGGVERAGGWGSTEGIDSFGRAGTESRIVFTWRERGEEKDRGTEATVS